MRAGPDIPKISALVSPRVSPIVCSKHTYSLSEMVPVKFLAVRMRSQKLCSALYRGDCSECDILTTAEENRVTMLGGGRIWAAERNTAFATTVFSSQG